MGPKTIFLIKLNSDFVTKSTVDCIFILHTIIQNVLHSKANMFCALIDYEKAFDTVIHDALWIKIVKTGISCNMLKMVQVIYQNVRSCIKDFKTMSYSEMFDVTLGVKQGELLSPLLFILFINDVKVVIHVEMPKAAPKKSICHFQKLEMILK